MTTEHGILWTACTVAWLAVFPALAAGLACHQPQIPDPSDHPRIPDRPYRPQVEPEEDPEQPAWPPGRPGHAPPRPNDGQPKRIATHDENIRWWRDRLKLRLRSPEARDECDNCEPELNELFLSNPDLADRARDFLDRDGGGMEASLICGVLDNASQFPDCVAIRIGTDAESFVVKGSGVLLNDRRTVLTVEHVIDRVANNNTARVVLGINALSPDVAFSSPIRSIGPRSAGGIVSVTLEDPVPASINLPDRDILDKDELQQGERVIVAGYGRDTKDANRIGKRQIVSVFVAETPCNDEPPDYGCRSDIEFVASEVTDSRCDSCSHDSGGPAFARRGGEWYIVGLTEGPIARDKAEALIPPCKPEGGCGCGARYVFASLHDN